LLEGGREGGRELLDEEEGRSINYKLYVSCLSDRSGKGEWWANFLKIENHGLVWISDFL
jgi:hypothetical protein